MDANGRKAPSGWLKATRPHGKPPAGHQVRGVSVAMITSDIHTGPPGSRVTTVHNAPPTPRNAASVAESASHGHGPK